MEDLPDLAFDKVLGYLDLKEVLRARAVSKEFYLKINKFRVRSLCYSEWERNFILGKNYLVVNEFAQNFICSSKFELFFANFGRSLLSSLRHLRICDLDVKYEALKFIEIVNSFQKLESLDLVHVDSLHGDFKLNLPKLKSIHFEELSDSFALTLDTPRLSDIRLWNWPRVD